MSGGQTRCVMIGGAKVRGSRSEEGSRSGGHGRGSRFGVKIRGQVEGVKVGGSFFGVCVKGRAGLWGGGGGWR